MEKFYNVELTVEHSSDHNTSANLKKLHLKVLKKGLPGKIVNYFSAPLNSHVGIDGKPKRGHLEVLHLHVDRIDFPAAVTNLVYTYWEEWGGFFEVKAVYPAKEVPGLLKHNPLNEIYTFDENDYDEMIEERPYVAQPDHFDPPEERS